MVTWDTDYPEGIAEGSPGLPLGRLPWVTNRRNTFTPTGFHNGGAALLNPVSKMPFAEIVAMPIQSLGPLDVCFWKNAGLWTNTSAALDP
jgi:hypothetical protein